MEEEKLGNSKLEGENDKLNDENISPNEYFKLRSAMIKDLKQNPETHPYPHKFHVSTSLEDFIEKYSTLVDSEVLHDNKLRYITKFLIYIFN